MPKISVGESFTVALFSGIEKFYASEGCHNFQSKLFCLTVPKNFEEEPFCAVFQKFPVAKKFMDKRGGGREAVSRLSVRSFFISQCRKIP